MTTLVVQLPSCRVSRNRAASASEWRLPALPFMLFDRHRRILRSGKSVLALLPKARLTVLLIAARDLLMLTVTMPPLKGARLRQALPNLVEDYLLQDARTCHIALDPTPAAEGARVLAVIDRNWFRFIYDTFIHAGHRNLRAAPLTYCLPAPALTDSQTPLLAVMLGHTETAEAVETAQVSEAALSPAANAPYVEWALKGAVENAGFAAPTDALADTLNMLNALAADAPLVLYQLVDAPGAPPPVRAANRDTLPLSFEMVARRALECRFDLCQFEFAVQPWRLSRSVIKRWRVPIALAGATLIVAVAGANLQWLMLARQRDLLAAQQIEVLMNAFPNTPTVLDPPRQMTRQLDALRLKAGALSPHDFLTLAAGLAASLGPIPETAIVKLDYQDRMLAVSFNPEAKIDSAFTQRLISNGLDGRLSSGKWIIRSRR